MSERNVPRPSLPSLEEDCHAEYVSLTRVIEEYYEATDGRPLVDDRIDLMAPAVEIEYLEGLTSLLGGKTHHDFLATHGAFQFAVYVAGLLDWQVNDLAGALPMLDDIADQASVQDAWSVIIESAQTYLFTRRELSDLFGLFEAHADPNGTFLTEAKAIYALTLRQIEFSGVCYYLGQVAVDTDEA